MADLQQTFFSASNLITEIEGIVLHDLFGLARGHAVTSDVAHVRVIPVEEDLP